MIKIDWLLDELEKQRSSQNLFDRSPKSKLTNLKLENLKQSRTQGALESRVLRIRKKLFVCYFFVLKFFVFNLPVEGDKPKRRSKLRRVNSLDFKQSINYPSIH